VIRSQIRVGGRWQHRASSRIAVVTRIVYPHFVEYKYERPTNPWSPWYPHPGTSPYTRRTRVKYRRFILNFERPHA
jgi:hypothetical protein